ncbi:MULTISPECIES: carboxymuconolactone decarboxylase family protein [Rhodococcus]|uniref:Carboxymuconolactone decarboxylase family protein n=2 Tax=Rhodococcus TaxID=1827 RepID=A0ABU7JLE7_9NOCA|nr:carboxymuconolactone decarboxylase family protein [Rhodococcus sp. CC-R104]MEE2030856.1 carboxymuconolactone decarboxylase family protein [Rhodococcus sp. CC-R104]TCN53622.1 AhpD family alkylhydroperoxidase [Rhodococcus sp. SMB37]
MPRIEPIPFDELDPDLRSRYASGLEAGRYTTDVPLRIYAYAKTYAVASDERYRLTFRQGLLDVRLEELLRIRSAQINGCGACSASRKNASISDEDVTCMAGPLESAGYSERERRALKFLDAFNRDHHAIGDHDLLELAEVFTTAEIVELGQMCATFIGTHRWTHILDVLDDSEPVLKFDPSEIDRPITHRVRQQYSEH